MKISSRFVSVLSCQSIGFLAVIALCWLNAILGLPSLIFDGRLQVSDFESPVLQMLLILAVWLLVSTTTRRSLEKIRQLESFLRVCSWCYHIEHKGEWMKMEQFFEQGFDTPTTHGICPGCLEKQVAALQETKRAPRIKEAKLEPIESIGVITSITPSPFIRNAVKNKNELSPCRP